MKKQPAKPIKKQPKQAIQPSWFNSVTATKIIFVLVFAVLGSLVISFGLAARKNDPPKSFSTGPTLSVSPTSQRTAVGQTLKLAVVVDSGDIAVNTVEAILTYPANTFDFVGIDGTGSAFPLAVQTTGGSGTIKITRAVTGDGVTGTQHVAYVSLRATAKDRAALVKFSDLSAVVDSQTVTNVLTKTVSGTYTIR